MKKLVSEKIRLSVVVPVFNAESLISQCLDSILSQDIEGLEVICVDDGSTDKSLEILRGYESNHENVIVISQSNQYAGVARNKGLEYACGEFVHFMDADDIVVGGAYKAICEIAESLEADYIKARSYSMDYRSNTIFDDNLYYNLKGIDKEKFGKVISVSDNIDDLMTTSCTPWSGIYRRSFIRDHGIHFCSQKCVNDRAFYDLLLCSNPGIVLYDGYAVIHRVNNENSLAASKRNPDNFGFYVDHMIEVAGLMDNKEEYIKNTILNYEMLAFSRNYVLAPKETQTRYGELISGDVIPLYYKILTERSKRRVEVRKILFLTGYVTEKEIKSKKELEQIIFTLNRFAIYGYGQMAKRFLGYLSNLGKRNAVSAIIITNEKDIPAASGEIINFLSVRDFKKSFDGVPIVVSVGDKYHLEIIEQIRSNQTRSEVYVLTDCFFDEIAEWSFTG